MNPVVTGRPILPKYFEKIFKTNDSVGVTRQQTWLRNEKIAEYFGENLDILTDLLWIFNNSKVFKVYFQKILAGSPFFQALLGLKSGDARNTAAPPNLAPLEIPPTHISSD